MLLPIQLNDELRLEAGEIRDVSSNRMLPPELEPAQLSPSQPPPKVLLGIDRRTPHRARGFSNEGRNILVSRHRPANAKPSPLVGEGAAEGGG